MGIFAGIGYDDAFNQNQSSMMSLSKFELLQDNIDLSAILGKSQQYSIYFIGGKSIEKIQG